MDEKTQEAMRDVSIPLRTILQEDDRNGQAGVRFFARSISIRRTSEARFIYSPKPDDFLWELCNVALLSANRNFQFEFARACCQVLVFILPNKTR